MTEAVATLESDASVDGSFSTRRVGELGMLWHQLRVEQLVFWRTRSSVFFTFVFPLMLLVIFASAGGSHDAQRFLIPGIAALAVVSTCFQAMAIGLAMHRDQGVLKRIIATPLPLGTLVLAKMLSVALVAILEIVIVILAGAVVYGIGWPAEPASFALCVVVGVLAFAAMGISLTAIIPSGDSAPAITNAAYLPMMLISNVFYDAGSSPQVVTAIARSLPLWHLATPMRATWLGNHDPHLLTNLGILAAWGIATGLFAARRLRWVPQHER